VEVINRFRLFDANFFKSTKMRRQYLIHVGWKLSEEQRPARRSSSVLGASMPMTAVAFSRLGRLKFDWRGGRPKAGRLCWNEKPDA
jgi:hypothetical protein